jgi:hypothetical protein
MEFSTGAARSILIFAPRPQSAFCRGSFSTGGGADFSGN